VTVNQSVSGSALAAHQVLAAEEHSAGGLGLLILVGLLAASAFLFVLLSRSLRRMRANVASGQFLGVDSDRLHEPIDPRQALRRRSAYLGGKAPVVEGEVVGGEDGGREALGGGAVAGQITSGDVVEGEVAGGGGGKTKSRKGGAGNTAAGSPVDLPVQPGPPPGR
jgi:hypothetical protein